MPPANDSAGPTLLEKWYPHTTTPFIASAPMYTFSDARLAAGVTSAGGYGMKTLYIYFQPLYI
jgi:nitronate monooxygenase